MRPSCGSVGAAGKAWQAKGMHQENSWHASLPQAQTAWSTHSRKPRKHPPVRPRASPARQAWASHLCMRPPQHLDPQTTAGSQRDRLASALWLLVSSDWIRDSRAEERGIWQARMSEETLSTQNYQIMLSARSVSRPASTGITSCQS